MTDSMLLDTYLKHLRLPTFVHNYRRVAEDAARSNLGYDRFLCALAEQEIGRASCRERVSFLV